MAGSGNSFNSAILSHDPLSSTAIHFCSNCEKPFNNENSCNRHFRYCSRRTRHRPRSCLACNAAKTKCSFGTPCSRCTKKGIDCVYNESLIAGRRRLPISPPAAAHSMTLEPCGDPTPLLEPNPIYGFGSSYADDDGTLLGGDFAFADDLDIGDDHLRFFNDNKLQPAEPTFDELFTSRTDAFGQHGFSTDVSLSFQHNLDKHSSSWCAWMHSNASLAMVTENTSLHPNLSLKIALPNSRTHAQHNADIIMQSLRSFPTMMLRKETFPWFVHPRSQLLPKAADSSLPEALSNGMSIAQMFASRTSETKRFLRQTIRAEHRRFSSTMHNMSNSEIFAAMQACMIYLIMYIIDYSSEDEVNVQELLQALLDLYSLFKEVSGECTNQSEVSEANPIWEDWIFAESRRRFANLWLLISFVVCVKNGNVCDPSRSYRILSLPSPKTLWEAPTHSVWESENEACRTFQTSGLVTIGDLIDAQQSDYTPSSARKLDKWNAGVDNLGCLLNLIGSME